MSSLEITIQNKSDNKWPIVFRHKATKDGLTNWEYGFLEIPPTLLNSQSYLFSNYGEQLGKSLFSNDLFQRFKKAESSAQSLGQKLRVQIIIESKELRMLHWEKLNAPFNHGWDYLILNQSTPFSIYLPSQIERFFPPLGKKNLSVLALVSGPKNLEGDYNLDPIDKYKIIDNLKLAFPSIPHTILSSNDGESIPSLDNLCNKLTDEKFKILHIICHSKVINSGETVLYLPKGETKTPVTGTEFIRQLQRIHSLPYLVFLSSCSTADPKAELSFGGFGQRLIREVGLPAVIAMSDSISVKTAEAITPKFYTKLFEHGELDSALVESLCGLQSRIDMTVPSLFTRLGENPIFLNSIDIPLTSDDIKFGLRQIDTYFSERAPILLETVQRLKNKISENLIQTPNNTKDSGIDHTSPIEELNQLSVECLEISFNSIALGEKTPKYDARCPFPGLYAFNPKDKDFFFGRDALIRKLAEKLTNNNFLALLGPSGCGKSSLVLAGIIPVLKSTYTYLVPGNEPLLNLDAAIKQSKDLLIVDQFEEIFTHCDNPNKREEFINKIITFSNSSKALIVMRADFWGECSIFSELKEKIQLHHELVGPMGPAELRKVIEQQAEAAGLRFEDGLCQRIMGELQNEPGAMPLLQHALLILWNRRRGKWLKSSEYDAFGGIRKGIARTADDTLLSYPQDKQELIKNIFLRLIRVDESSNIGGDKRDTRRRISISELLEQNNGTNIIKKLISQLADKRLVITSFNLITNNEEIEISHEALIKAWPRLSGWIDELRTFLELREDIRRDALDWDKNARENSYLLHQGKRLQEALSLFNSSLKLNRTEIDYISACQDSEEKQNILIADVYINTDNIMGDNGAINIYIKPKDSEFELDYIELNFFAKGSLKLDIRELNTADDGYGLVLSRSFYQDESRKELFIRILKEIRNEVNRLLIFWIDQRLIEWHGIYWETLNYPDTDGPITNTNNISITRHIEISRRNRLLQKRELKVLEFDLEVTDETFKGCDIVILQCVDTELGTLRIISTTTEKTFVISIKELTKQLRSLRNAPKLVFLLPKYDDERISIVDNSRMVSIGIELLRYGVSSFVITPKEKHIADSKIFILEFLKILHESGDTEKAFFKINSIKHGDSASILYTTQDGGVIWRELNITEFSKRIPALADLIKNGKCTPIIGTEISEQILGSYNDIALSLAKKYSVPKYFYQTDFFSKIANFIAVDQDSNTLFKELENSWKNALLERFKDSLQTEFIQHDRDLLAILDSIASQIFDLPGDIYLPLAKLDLPLYITMNFDNTLENALRLVGKKPELVIAPWSERFAATSIYDREPDYRPTPERPLVYHFLGHYSLPDSLVITEDDWFEWIIGLIGYKDLVPSVIRRIFRDTAIVFLGFSFNEFTQNIIKVFMDLQGGGRRSRYAHALVHEPFSGPQSSRINKYIESYLQYYSIDIFWGSPDNFLQIIFKSIDKK